MMLAPGEVSDEPPVTAGLSPLLFNAPGRLWAFLVSVRTRGENDAPAWSAIADYLGLGTGSALIAAALAAAARMPRQARDELAGVEPPPALPRGSLDAALADARGAITALVAPGAPLGRVREAYGPSTLTTLKGAGAWLIGAGDGARAGSGAALAGIGRLAEEARTATTAAPDAGVAVLQARVAAVVDAVRLFPLTGQTGLVDAARAIEEVLRRPDVRAAAGAVQGLERHVQELAASLRAFERGAAG
jgi:hypothetical protein